MTGYGWMKWALSAGCCVWLSACRPVEPGPAVDQVLADGVLTCEEQINRNQFNVCPADPPPIGADGDGVVWNRDRFFGLPNPFHGQLDCYRGQSPALGISSYQCCYDGPTLVEDGPLAGSFDFANPNISLITLVLHVLWDVLSPTSCP